MKKILLILTICVVIDSGRELFKAGRMIIFELSDFRQNYNKAAGTTYTYKQIVLNILLLSNEGHCPG